MSLIREFIVKPLTRSKGWRKVRKAHILLNPRCAVCGGKRGLEVHHKEDFSTNPELELDPDNLLTLCRPKRCHLLFGHLNSWKSINPTVVEDADIWKYKIIERR